MTFTNNIAQSTYRVNLSGGLGYLFEASVANEEKGSFSGIGIERMSNNFSIYLDFEKSSFFSSHILGINTVTQPNGEVVISDYKGHINLEQRDFAFDDVFVDQRILNAGKSNYVGSRQVFRSQSLILGFGYQIYKQNRWSISPKLGIALSLNNAVAPNIAYTTSLNVTGRRFLVTIPTYTKYLYASGYLSIPITYEINNYMELSIVGSLYRAREIYLPLYGLSASFKII